jgi:hypothetical protein
MTVTVEVINRKTLNLLNDLESMGLIHIQPSVPQNAVETAGEAPPPYQWLRGIHAGIPEASVDNFLARCREDKEYELAIEKRQEEEHARYANTALSS